MPYNRKARRGRGANADGCSKMPEGVVLVGGKGGTKDAAYAFAADVSSPDCEGAVPRPLASIHGWAFWDSIGRPKYVCAPMVEQSELSFRQVCRRYGTTLAYTPMFHARLFLEVCFTSPLHCQLPCTTVHSINTSAQEACDAFSSESH
jgi:hypothetical protein